MLLKLHGRQLRPLGPTSIGAFIGRIRETVTTTIPTTEPAKHEILLLDRENELRAGFRAYLIRASSEQTASPMDAYVLGDEMHYLADGDVVRIDPRRSWIHVLYRRTSPNNSFLVTERCDNYCVMCSQPPKEHDDSWLVDELEQIIPLVSTDTAEIGLTGGEPGLLGQRLVELVARLKHYLPRTAVHILTNGRAFADEEFARSIARVRHHDLMLGIPIYSDLPEEHDYVVQARGAFNQTIRGVLNLKQHGVRVEVRVVIHAETYKRLPELAEFLRRNLLFVDHVALMGLEPTGFAKSNIERLWVDPLDYQPELIEAAELLDRAGVHVSIYNHQLCVLDPRLHRFSRRSISDWKNAYFDECSTCTKQADCGGFFASSSLRRSRGVEAFPHSPK